MNIVAMIAIVGLVFGMVKKNEKEGFKWQQTLGGLKAIQWLKPGIEFTPIKLEFGLGSALAGIGYSVSEWNLEKDCVVLHEKGGAMPLMIGSRAILNYFGDIAKGWEACGSVGVSNDNVDEIVLAEGEMTFTYTFDRGEGQFDPYTVTSELNTSGM